MINNELPKKNKKVRTILEELDAFIPENKKVRLVESKGDHLVNSCINFFYMLEENFTQEQVDLLTSRFFSAIRNKDARRFERGLKHFKQMENKNNE